MSYSKDDVQLHRIGYSYRASPAVNVKAYNFPSPWKVEEEFGCSEKIAEQANGYAFNMAAQMFWDEYAPEIAEDVFGKGTKIYSEGRSGGWLVVEGIDDIEYWDAIALAKWRSFECRIKAVVKDLCSWEHVKEDIEANRWAEEGAEEYNFIDTNDGQSHCIVDLKKELVNA